MSVGQGQAGIEPATDAEFDPGLVRAIAKLPADKDGPIFNGKAPAMVDEDDLELVRAAGGYRSARNGGRGRRRPARGSTMDRFRPRRKAR